MQSSTTTPAGGENLQTPGGILPRLRHIARAMKEVVTVSDRQARTVLALPPVHATTVSTTGPNTAFDRLFARLRSWFEIPFGYEDATGFHYGHEPVPTPATPWSNAAGNVLTDRACDAMLTPGPQSATTAGAAPTRGMVTHR